MKNFFLLFILLLLFLPPTALSVDSMSVSLSLEKDGWLVETVSFQSEELSILRYTVQEGLFVREVLEGNCGRKGNTLECYVIEEQVKFLLEGNAKELGYLEDTEDGHKFTFNVETPRGTQLDIRMELPPNAKVFKNNNNITQIFPSPIRIGLHENMESIVLEWSDEGTSSFSLFVEYGFPRSGENYLQVILLVLGLGLVAGTFVGTKLRKRKRATILLKDMRDSEREIVDALKAHEGKMEQKRIERETGFSGPKVSKLLRRMEEDGVVKRIPKGRKNLVELHL
jgi:predicted transcriptional regulator